MNPVGSARHPQASNSVTKPAPLARALAILSLVIAALWIGACGGSDGGTSVVTVGSVTVNPPTNAFVSIGQTAQLTAAVADDGGAPITDKTVTWSSSNNAVATVSASGLVTSTGNGIATITATCEGVTGDADVSVAQVIASVAVTPGTPTLVSLGATIQLTATPKDANGNPITGQTATWSSSDNGIATVSGLGLVTAVANGGPVTITATVGAFTGTAAATVAQVVSTVDVTPPATTLIAVASTVQLAAAPKDALGHPVLGQTVTWSSSNSSIAMVGPTGLGHRDGHRWTGDHYGDRRGGVRYRDRDRDAGGRECGGHASDDDTGLPSVKPYS